MLLKLFIAAAIALDKSLRKLESYWTELIAYHLYMWEHSSLIAK